MEVCPASQTGSKDSTIAGATPDARVRSRSAHAVAGVMNATFLSSFSRRTPHGPQEVFVPIE